MICDNCMERQATVHLTKIINGIKQESHLCDVCAQGAQHTIGFEQHPAFFDFLTGLLSSETWGQPSTAAFHKPQQCPNCKSTYQNFSKTGFLGCSECYKQFSDSLDTVLRRIHGANRHSGKVPERRGGSLKLYKELDNLRRQLQQVVASEEFEQAATLRDRIKELEKQTEGEER